MARRLCHLRKLAPIYPGPNPSPFIVPAHNESEAIKRGCQGTNCGYTSVATIDPGRCWQRIPGGTAVQARIQPFRPASKKVHAVAGGGQDRLTKRRRGHIPCGAPISAGVDPPSSPVDGGNTQTVTRRDQDGPVAAGRKRSLRPWHCHIL